MDQIQFEIEMAVGPEYLSHWFTVVPDTTTTICALTLTNGFTLVGKSACVNPEMFNEELGRKYAAEDAVRQVGEFIGWRMADKRNAALI